MKSFITGLLVATSGMLVGAIPLASENPQLTVLPSHGPTREYNFTTFTGAGVDASTVAIKGYVQNNCKFPIYVQYATCCPEERRKKGDKCVDSLVTLNPDKGYWSSGVARNDACSQTIRMFKVKGSRDVYQLEYSVHKDGIVWYNLSSVDGSPFTPEPRFLTVRRGCQEMYCRPGHSPPHCDWPDHMGSCAAGDVRCYLC